MLLRIDRFDKAAPQPVSVNPSVFFVTDLSDALLDPFIRLFKALDHIHSNLDQPVSVDKLAQVVHMSRTAFYLNFKDVMQVSPLQYAKSVKLFEAQKLIKEGKRVNEASYLIGYNNLGQFSREYKRYFGFVPSATCKSGVVSKV